MQAASPNLEISKLFKLTGEAYKAINYLSILIVSLSFVGILFTLLKNISERRYDLAILRTLGFSKEKIFSIILIEGMTISFLGSFIGLMFGGIVYKCIENFSLLGKNIITGQFEFISELIVVWFIILIISFLACLIPCIKAYKQNIRSTLLNN